MSKLFDSRLADVIRKPIITEKATNALDLNQYTFEVDHRAAKPQIKAAVEDFGSNLDKPKTSEIVNGLSRLGIEKTEKVLVILDSPSVVIKKSINNIAKVKLIAADQLNVFDILNANKLVIGQSAINKIQEVYAS